MEQTNKDAEVKAKFIFSLMLEFARSLGDERIDRMMDFLDAPNYVREFVNENVKTGENKDE